MNIVTVVTGRCRKLDANDSENYFFDVEDYKRNCYDGYNSSFSLILAV